jgi:hypothetical protein
VTCLELAETLMYRRVSPVQRTNGFRPRRWLIPVGSDLTGKSRPSPRIDSNSRSVVRHVGCVPFLLHWTFNWNQRYLLRAFQ